MTLGAAAPILKAASSRPHTESDCTEKRMAAQGSRRVMGGCAAAMSEGAADHGEARPMAEQAIGKGFRPAAKP